MIEHCTRTIRTLGLFALLAGIALGGRAEAGDEAEKERRVDKLYPLYYLDAREAGLIIEQNFGAHSPENSYDVQVELPRGERRPDSSTGYLRVFAAAALQEKIEAVLKRYDAPPPNQVFQIFLLEATKQTSDSLELPPGASRAVQDLRELLPFKGFRLLQSAMIRSSQESMTNLGGEYSLNFQIRSPREPGKPILFERFALQNTLADKDRRPTVLQTSFSINQGETVVVGTSKLDGGDHALVVLLTALK